MILAVVAVLFVQADYEDELYDQLIDSLELAETTETEQAVALMGLSHALIWPRKLYFDEQPYIDIRGSWFRSGDIELIDGRGDCASFAGVLGRLLLRAGMEVRQVLMKCAVGSICHVSIEARANGRWIALDPTYNLAFRKRDGSYASVAEVSANWDYFSRQTPAEYEEMFSYDGWSYTNWNKFPTIMPAIKSALDYVLGKDAADEISIRPYVLNVYRTYGYALLVAYVLLVIATVAWYRRARPIFPPPASRR